MKINTVKIKNIVLKYHLNLQHLSWFLYPLLGVLVELVYIWLT